MADYDLAYKKISELTEDGSPPASADWLVRFDDSDGAVKKVAATNLEAVLGITATIAELNIIDGVTANTAEMNALDNSIKSTIMEDFHGTWTAIETLNADMWLSTKGSGQATAVATTVSNSLNGEITITSSDLDAAISANASNISGATLGYKANQGGLVLEARMKISDVSEAVLFVGFTDVLGSTVELPLFLVTSAIDSDAANACGVGYDDDGTTSEFFHGGVKANTDTTPAYSGGAPADSVYFTVRVEVSAAGAVQGFINGTAIGDAVANAVTITTALTPILVIANRSANPVILTVDYIMVQQNR